MRLAFTHEAETAAQIEALRERDGYVSDISVALRYRPELFAAFVSVQNQCPF